MKTRMRFDYFYGSQAEQFSFIRIPRILIKDPRFSPLSVYAKMLYAVLLDRMSLSSKNGWFDEDNRVYIIYPTAEAQEDLGIGKKKALEVMSELVEFGLLEKKRRGLGLPNLLYLKSFMSGGTEADTSVSKTIINRKCQSEASGGVQTDSSESFPQEPAEVSGPVLPEVPDPGPQRKKNNNNYIYPSETSSDHIQDQEAQIAGSAGTKRCDEKLVDNAGIVRELICENIRYKDLLITRSPDREMIDGIVDLIQETILTKGEYILIASNKYPAEVVRGKFMRLEYGHICYVLDCLRSNTTKVKNIRKYLLAVLFNAPSTMTGYYQAEVNHDMPQYAS